MPPEQTAQIILTLAGYATTSDVGAALDKAAHYLIAQQGSDGGWGQAGSTVVESALAYRALRSWGSIPDTTKSSAVAYLEGKQSPNGSWNDHPYDTALALFALGDYRLLLPVVLH